MEPVSPRPETTVSSPHPGANRTGAPLRGPAVCLQLTRSGVIKSWEEQGFEIPAASDTKAWLPSRRSGERLLTCISDPEGELRT